MPTSQINPEKAQGGFTLLELMIVIALTMIGLAVFSLTIGGPTDEGRVSQSARQIISGLNYARSLTALRGESVDFRIHPDKRTFWIEELSSPTIVNGGVSLSVRSAREVFSDGGTPTIRFLPDGSATGGRIILTAGQARRQIEIDWLTGLVSIAE